MIPIRYTRNLFLRALCVVYLFAFLSFYIQSPGLYGDNGLLPAKSVLENSKHKTLSAKVHYQPTLLWLAPYVGLDTNYALDVLSLIGSFLAFTGFVSQKLCTIPLFAGLWSLYFSLYQIGQVFVSNNYDDLLLEVGFITLLVAPLLPGRKKGPKISSSDAIGFWLLKWILFRFFLTTGLAKLISGCPEWWNLRALNYHFESMPLPSPLSWYSHHIPQWFLKLTTVFTNVCEIGLPFMFFVPFRIVRITAFVFQIFLQICIVLTGNFSFLNLLIVTLLLSLLDDQFFYAKKNNNSGSYSNIIWKIANVVIYGAVIYGSVLLYNIKFNGTNIDSNIAFTKDQFQFVLRQGINLGIYYTFVYLGLTVIQSIGTAWKDAASLLQKILSVFVAVLYGLIAVVLFVGATVPLKSLDPVTNSTIHPYANTIYNRLHKLHVINQYGLFPKMTGQQGRPEIIIEGAENVDGPWAEYNFLYKPGNVNYSLPFVAPYSPRLDWQMYWAAYSTYEKQPWIMSLVHRLLNGKHEVLTLIDIHHSPFTKKPPKYIRASLYKYKYTSWAQKSQTSWWKRERVGEYFPAFSKDSSALLDYLRARNLLPTPSIVKVSPLWKQVLDTIRYVTSHLEATLLLWSVFTAGCAIITTSGH